MLFSCNAGDVGSGGCDGSSSSGSCGSGWERRCGGVGDRASFLDEGFDTEGGVAGVGGCGVGHARKHVSGDGADCMVWGHHCEEWGN